MRKTMQLAMIALALLASSFAANVRKQSSQLTPPPDILLEGGRKLVFERTFRTEKEVLGKQGFWTKVVNFVAGEPVYKEMIRPYSIVVDSRGRAMVTDPGAGGVHIFDFAKHKYKFLERKDKDKDAMHAPQCVALDAADNIYVTDSVSGKIFVFDAEGKFKRALGSHKGGEGFFKRPTGIAVDSAAQQIYVTDTLRNKIFVLDMQGTVLRSIGTLGIEDGQFNFPTELLVHGQNVYAVDAMNFRVETFSKNGQFKATIGRIGDGPGDLYRPKAIGVDSEDHLYVVDSLLAIVQVFDSEGHLLYYFGGKGQALGQFQLPSGLFIGRDDRVFVVDSYNRRVQVFQYHGIPVQGREARQ